MSGNSDGPLTIMAQAYAQHAQLPPPQKAVARTSYGCLLLVACIYTAVTLGPDAVHRYPPAAVLGFAGAAGLGLLLFVNGLRGPRLPVEFMTKFWVFFWAGAFTAGSWWLAVHQPEWWANVYVRGFCISFTAAQWIDCLLVLRPMSGDAEKAVRQNMQTKNPPIVPPRRRT